jgi:hypothetical protein
MSHISFDPHELPRCARLPAIAWLLSGPLVGETDGTRNEGLRAHQLQIERLNEYSMERWLILERSRKPRRAIGLMHDL